jgi:nitroreductase
MDKNNIDALTVIGKRKSVRHYTGQSISKDDLQKILKAGMAAPSAVNYQPWEFMVVTKRELLDKLADGLPYAKMLNKAGAAIIVCAVPEKAFENSLQFAIIDSTLASENILIAVEALNLGAVWTAVYPEKGRMEFVTKTLKIPSDIIPLNVIPVGVPEGVEEPKDKYKENYIHWEKW